MLLVLIGARRAPVHRVFNRGTNASIAMAKQRSAVRAAQIDIFAAIQIPQPAPGGAVEVERMTESLIDASGGGDTGGEGFFGKLEVVLDARHRPTYPI